MIEYFSRFGYVGIAAAIILTGFGLPMPEELPVLFSGVLIGHADTPGPDGVLDANRLRWWIMVPVVIVAIVTGDGLLYAVGRRWGHKLFENGWVKRRIITPETRTAIEKNFQERGVMVLLTARLTPGIRTPIFLMAGHYRVSFAKFLLADGLYAIPGVMAMFWVAYWFTDQVLLVFHKIEHYKQLATFGILSAAVGIVLYKLFFDRKTATGSPKEVPILAKPVEKVTEAVEHVVEKAATKAYDVVVHHIHHDAKPPEDGGPPEDVKLPEPSANGSSHHAKDAITTESPKLPPTQVFPG
ncbi:DedA family protein [Limnoglobus roseus]|uniref:DedA family protein n=1 Tax=Limnoglobus roseus TaxID=2598579 RepID=A0A5C1ACD3_9BACT|nr:DedA family protein [Limnoglobus roseus]QEL14698.1 DedA family protein [Limnoglobus roseus]